jgi:hypothetical protein
MKSAIIPRRSPSLVRTRANANDMLSRFLFAASSPTQRLGEALVEAEAQPF